MIIQAEDIFSTPAECYVCPVNCVGVMGKGLALEFKNRYPSYFLNYKLQCESGDLIPGVLHVYRNNETPVPSLIVSFPTKMHWKDQSTYEMIVYGIRSLHNVIRVEGIKSISIPAVGCGLGGLEYSRVQGLITYLHKHNNSVTFYVIPPR